MTLTLATYNVKDLLEPRGDAARRIFADKLDFIAEMLRICDADVVGLQEIGPPALLDAVLDRLAHLPGGRTYGAPVMGTADARGIRCALLSRLPVLESRVHTAEALPFPVFREGDPLPFGSRIPLRRGIVHARVDAPGLGPIDVLVGHFKSSRPVPPRDAGGRELPATSAHVRAEGAVRSLVWRTAEALYVRRLVDDLLTRAGSEAPLAVVGDLNDVPDSPAVRAVRGQAGELGELFDCAASVDAAARFSTLHDGRATQIDHILASATLFARLETARFFNDDLRQHPPVPTVTVGESREGGSEGVTVDSDHAPLVTRFG
jgi:endonuclease/exonuclease/phosphatase family metal-dependent hydrolase